MQRRQPSMQVIYSSAMYYKCNSLPKTYNADAIPHVNVWLSSCRIFSE